MFQRVFFALSVVMLPTLASAGLETRECGAIYGGLSFVFEPGVTPKELAQRFKDTPWARETYETVDVEGNHRIASFYRRLLSAKIYSYRDGASGVDVPIGSEEFIGHELRKTRLVSDIALPWGDCGGAEIAYFSLGKLKGQSELTDPSNFRSAMQSAALQYATSQKIRGLSIAGSMEVKTFTAYPISPNLPVGRIRFTVASEISRDRRSKATWDQFDVIFNLWKAEKADSLVTVSIERYRNAPRAGRDTPPSEDHFSAPTDNESWDDEMVISSSVAAYFSRYFKGKCTVDGEGIGGGDDGDPFGCDGYDPGKQ